MSQIKNVFEANFKDHKNQFRAIIMGLIAVLILVALFTMFYTVQAESQGVVLRFGRYIKTVEPGLKFKLPFGIDTVQIVPVRRQLKQEFGVHTRDATNPYQHTSSSEQQREKNMVTGDLNAATVEWIVQFRVNDPRQFLFQVKEPESTLRAVSESVMREVVGDRTVDEVITVGRQEIEVVALGRMQELVDNYKMGLSIDQVQLKDVNPPLPVQPSFNEVNQAQQQREQLINQANGEYNKVVPRARGEADQKIRSAEGYALKRVNEADGDAAKFTALFTEYKKAPDVTKRRLHLETMKSVIPKMGKKIILDSDAKQILPLLQLAPDNK